MRPATGAAIAFDGAARVSLALPRTLAAHIMERERHAVSSV
jgi:hypothetical protein